MSTESRASGRWVAVSLVVLTAAGLALLFRAGDSEPLPLGGPIAVESRDSPRAPLSPAGSASPPPALDWPDGPELDRSYELAAGEPFALSLDTGDVVVRPAEGRRARVRVELVGGSRPPARFEWVSTRDETSTSLRIRSQARRSFLSRLFSWDEQDQGELRVEGERVQVDGRRARVGRVLVELPADSPLTLRSGAGKLSVSDHGARVEVDSGAGEVRVERIAASARIDTGAGDVHVDDIAGDAEIDTGAGDVTARSVRGRLVVDTGAGSVRFFGAPASVTIDTGAGGVEGELESLVGDLDIDTGMGRIELRLPAGSQAELFAESGLGSVTAELDGQRLKASRGSPLRATLGEGGPPIRLRTGTGNIRVSERANSN